MIFPLPKGLLLHIYVNEGVHIHLHLAFKLVFFLIAPAPKFPKALESARLSRSVEGLKGPAHPYLCERGGTYPSSFSFQTCFF